METQAEAVSNKEPAAQLYRNRNFLFLISAQTISIFGDGVYALGLLWGVKLLTGSGAEMSLVLTAETFPAVLLGLLAGVIVDRGRKKRFLQYSDLVRALIIGCVAVLWQFQVMSVGLFVISAFFIACFSTFFSPARSIALRTVVPETGYQKAMSASQTVQTVVGLCSPAVAGILIAISPAFTFYFDAASFFVSLVLISLIKEKSLLAKNNSDRSFAAVRKSLNEGFQTVLSQPLLRNLIIFMFLLNLILAPITVLVPVYANNVSNMAIMETVFTFGMLGGSIIAGFTEKLRRVYVLCGGLFLIMISFYGLYVVHSLVLACFCLIVAGIGAPIVNITMSTIFSLNVPRETLGRASSMVQVIIKGAMPGALALTGAVLILFNARELFLLISLFGIIVILLMALNQTVRKA